VVKQKWLRAMGEGNGLRPAQSNGQKPNQGLWRSATGLGFESP
jgi:hypothetical protein